MRTVKIAVGKDGLMWHEKFLLALGQKKKEGLPIDFDLVDIDSNNWVQAIEPYDIILWKPAFIGSEIAGLFKEKIFFIENYLGKIVVPNFKTVWHYDSKIAQSYLFYFAQFPTPKTFSSFSYSDSIKEASNTVFPIVIKKSWGAASKNVSLVKNFPELKNKIESIFFQELWENNRHTYKNNITRLLKTITQPWFWAKITEKLQMGNRLSDCFGTIYWQAFIPNNEADLRITVIGDCFAYGFWRNNRPNDFRASGSGKIDYERSIPLEIINDCISYNTKMGFDSMAYDILFDNKKFVINEISYAYVDRYLFNLEGYYQKKDDGVIFYQQHTWPQQLWVEWLLRQAGLI